MSLRQKLALFWSRIDGFWNILAMGATLFVFVASTSFFEYIIGLFDANEWLSMWLSFVISGTILISITQTYMKDLDYKKPTQPFKLRQLVFPKKFYSPKMWVAEAPYTAVFILFVVLWLVSYGWYFWQFNLSPREFFIAYLTLALLGAVYVFCVLAQGYRDFFNDDEPALKEVRKQ